MIIEEKERTFDITINETERKILIQALGTFPYELTAKEMRKVLEGMNII